MAVIMEKASDAVRAINPGAGANDGSGPLRFIGGMPTRKISGPAIRVSGMRYAGRSITCVVIEPVRGSIAQTSLISADGIEHSYGDVGDVIALRTQWLRRTLSDGTFAGVARLR